MMNVMGDEIWGSRVIFVDFLDILGESWGYVFVLVIDFLGR